jgi:hypothetical protein
MRPSTAPNEREASTAVDAVTTGPGIEPDAAIMGICELEQADDYEQRAQSVADQGNDESHQSDEAQRSPSGEAEEAHDGRTGELCALQEFVGAIAGGEFVGSAECGEGGADDVFGSDTGRLIEDVGMDLFDNVIRLFGAKR